MALRGMAFAASRAERPLPVVENSGGGQDLNRYIPGNVHRVPGYTGHVPGRKIEATGIGMTYGHATGGLMNPGQDVNPLSFTTPSNPTDFRQTANKSIGGYTRPGDDPAKVYESETQKVMARGASHLDYVKREKKTIPGYTGFIPQTRSHIGGPGDQYWAEHEGTMDGTASMSRTEYRDTTGKMPGAYDKPWLANTVPKGPAETTEKAWRPALEHGGQDAWHPGESSVPKLSHATLGMGPRTTESQYPTGRGYQNAPQIKYGRRSGSQGNAHVMTTGGSGLAAEADARAQQLEHKETAHGHVGNVVTSLTTTADYPGV